MAVYQVEEYYISTLVPSEKKEDVEAFLDSGELDCVFDTFSWFGNSLHLEGFDDESEAERCNEAIKAVIEGEV